MVATYSLPQDTPIRRACIADMTDDQIEQHIVAMQAQRMAAATAYAEAQQMKAQLKSAKDAIVAEKRLVQIAKILETTEKGLDRALKYCAEIKVLRLTQ